MTDSTAIDLLKTDLAAFADPGSVIESVEIGTNQWKINWIENADVRTAVFEFDHAEPSIVYMGEEVLTYAGFLAGPRMGNLRALARNTLSIINPLVPFVAPRAHLDGDQPQDGDALELLSSAAQAAEDLTSVVFVAADAGVGKTSLLKEAVRGEAERYLRGETDTLWVYVDAQARRLAALDEALASELDRLRAKFSFDAAAPLVRTGAITLVVDGFDELIGSVGAYDEAFNGLADFIASLQGGGTLVAAARSSYYEQEFLSRVQRGLGRGDRWILKPLRLRDWQEEQRREYVTRVAEAADETAKVQAIVESVETALSSSELSGVAGKPFFVARTTELVLDDALPETDTGTNLLDRLVRAYIDREVGKLLDATRRPLLSSDGLRSFFDELAIEMWRQESRELTRTSVREIATLIGEVEGLKEDDIKEVTTRAQSFAMLRVGSSQGSIAWEHDVFFAYFLSQPVAATIGSADPRMLARLLKRGRLPEDAASMVGRLTQHIESQRFLDLLVATGLEERVEVERVRRNAGLLAAGRLSGARHSDLRMRDLTIGDVAIKDAAFDNAELSNIEFSGTDLTSTTFEGGTATKAVTFDRVVVSGETRLDIANVSVEHFYGLRFRTGDSEEILYSPGDILQRLRQTGLPAAIPDVRLRAVNESTLQLVERLCRMYSRTNVIAEGGDHDDKGILNHPKWETVRRALLESGVSQMQMRPASGQKVFIERTVRADEILAGLDLDAPVDARVSDFWDLLSA